MTGDLVHTLGQAAKFPRAGPESRHSTPHGHGVTLDRVKRQSRSRRVESPDAELWTIVSSLFIEQCSSSLAKLAIKIHIQLLIPCPFSD